MSFTIYGQTKVYELITKIEGTNQSARNALSEVENLIISIIWLQLINLQEQNKYRTGWVPPQASTISNNHYNISHAYL